MVRRSWIDQGRRQACALNGSSNPLIHKQPGLVPNTRHGPRREMAHIKQQHRRVNRCIQRRPWSRVCMPEMDARYIRDPCVSQPRPPIVLARLGPRYRQMAGPRHKAQAVWVVGGRCRSAPRRLGQAPGPVPYSWATIGCCVPRLSTGPAIATGGLLGAPHARQDTSSVPLCVVHCPPRSGRQPGSHHL